MHAAHAGEQQGVGAVVKWLIRPWQRALIDAEWAALDGALFHPLHDEHPRGLAGIPAQEPLFPAPEHPAGRNIGLNSLLKGI